MKLNFNYRCLACKSWVFVEYTHRNGVIRQPAAKLAQRGASLLSEDVMVEKTSHTQGSISEEQNHNG